MEAALILLPVVEKNRRAYIKTLLVNNNKCKNYRADTYDSNYTLVYYALRESRRHKRAEFKTALTVAQVDARVREDANEPAIPLYVTTKGGLFQKKKQVNRVEYINLDSWIWAWNNTDGVTSTLWIEEGAFKIIELQLNHTIEQISARASESASFSESGM